MIWPSLPYLSAGFLVVTPLVGCDGTEARLGGAGSVRDAAVSTVEASRALTFRGASQAVIEPGRVGAAEGSRPLLEVTGLVPSSVVTYVRHGDPATVTFDRLPDGSFRIVGREELGEARERVTVSAHVSEVGAHSFADGSTTTVTVRFEQAHPLMRPGMAAVVELSLRSDDGAERTRAAKP